VEQSLAERIDAVLPQTQCTRCGYDGCRPYADAVAARAADINRCPPGGATAMVALAAITGRAAKPIAADCGTFPGYRTARIDESYCIGCTLCIDACPVDAILGGPKQMHVVLAHLCSGCERCIAPCPVDCIAMHPADRAWNVDDAAAARSRYRVHIERLARGERIADRGATVPSRDAAATRATTVAAAMERARARRADALPRAT
jgi:electron transport complex protein RnfB